MNTAEIEKYRYCYSLANYKMGKRRERVMVADVDSIPKGKTYVDVGCGRGESVKYALEKGLQAFGTELVPELCNDVVLHAEMSDLLPISADYVSCYDVLEHIPPDELQDSLDGLFAAVREVLFVTTNDHPSHWNGRELHLSRHPIEFWTAEFEKRAEKVHFEVVIGEWHWKCLKTSQT